MSEFHDFDLVVVGGGPAGYVGAIRAAQLGMSVACVEHDKLGGICLNWGCIPTKSLLAGADLYRRIKHDAGGWGISVDKVNHNWEKVISRSRGTAGSLNKGIHALFKKNKIRHIEGRAKIKAGNSGSPVIEIWNDDKKHRTIQAAHTLIATGGVPRALPNVGFDREQIISYKEAMVLPEQPKNLVIVGAGAIGMEFAYFYNAFGTRVTIVEMLDRLLPAEDHEVSDLIGRSFRKQGIKALVGHKILSIERANCGIRAVAAPVDNESKTQTLEADRILIAAGVKGNLEGLFEPDHSVLGVELDRDHLKVDRTNYQTTCQGLYAVGDVIGPPWLAHVASEEAVVCVERMAGHHPTPIDYESIPGCTYCHPQVASIGLTEQACQQRNIDFQVGKFPFQASGKALALGETDGFAKILTDKKFGQVLGAHLIGDNVTELISEIGLARRLEATAQEIIATIHPHPTLSEAIHEATLGTQGRMIHL